MQTRNKAKERRGAIESILRGPQPLYIVSGEGNLGTVEDYTGKRTARAVKARLTRERCGGDRWARIETKG